MDPHGLPSGGDWGLERLGAIRLNGTEDIAITDSLFHKLDGNAIFVDGYNRRAGACYLLYVWSSSCPLCRC